MKIRVILIEFVAGMMYTMVSSGNEVRGEEMAETSSSASSSPPSTTALLEATGEGTTEVL